VNQYPNPLAIYPNGYEKIIQHNDLRASTTHGRGSLREVHTFNVQQLHNGARMYHSRNVQKGAFSLLAKSSISKPNNKNKL